MGISLYKSGKSKTIEKVLEKFSFKYSDMVKLINCSKILDALSDDNNRDDYIKLWNKYAFIANSLQNDDSKIEKILMVLKLHLIIYLIVMQILSILLKKFHKLPSCREYFIKDKETMIELQIIKIK